MTVHKNLKGLSANGRGFTLIELLIVMAILGVLAVVVLVAINPVQQLARTRDTGRISSVAQIGHAVEAYYASHNGNYPTDLDELTTSGELTSIPAQVNNSTDDAYCTVTPNEGWCYAADTDSFAIWSRLEADLNKTIGNACDDATTDVPYAVYSSSTGSTCITCGGEPDENFPTSPTVVCDNL